MRLPMRSVLTTLYEIKGDVANAHDHYDYKMHLNGDSLLVCTPTGVKYVDLKTNKVSDYAFTGQDVRDFVQKGDAMLGLLVIKTIEDDVYWVTSEDRGATYKKVAIPNLNSAVIEIKQHPTNPDVVFVLDIEHIWRSKDFGKTWENVCSAGLHNVKGNMEFHPLDPNIVCCHSENFILNSTLYVSMDGGDTWEYNVHVCDVADNCMHQMDFHPTEKDTWVSGGENVVVMTKDAGKTWELLLNGFDGDESIVAYFYATVWDHQNDSIIYCAGTYHDGVNRARITATPDGGKTWEKVFESVNVGQDVKGLTEYKDNLLFYTSKGLYLIRKADVRPHHASGIRPIDNKKIYFSVSQHTVTFANDVESVDIYNSAGMWIGRWFNGGSCVTLDDDGLYLFTLKVNGTLYSSKALIK